jgi:hypothetical protein
MPNKNHVDCLLSFNEEGFIEKLDFSKQDFDENMLDLILKFINEQPSHFIEEISFKSCGITNELVFSLYDIFDTKLLPNLRILDLSNNFITEKGLTDLLYINEVHGNRAKKQIILENNDIDKPADVIKKYYEIVKEDGGKILPIWDFSMPEESTLKVSYPTNKEKVKTKTSIEESIGATTTTNETKVISAIKASGIEGPNNKLPVY